tara:strand:+ start:2813 stop:2950 length:138 start_codon:yes stop_codon:yes gene_type:complete
MRSSSQAKGEIAMELLTALFIIKTGVMAVILLGLWVMNRSFNQAS